MGIGQDKAFQLPDLDLGKSPKRTCLDEIVAYWNTASAISKGTPDVTVAKNSSLAVSTGWLSA
jgi:hypothetical protein